MQALHCAGHARALRNAVIARMSLIVFTPLSMHVNARCVSGDCKHAFISCRIMAMRLIDSSCCDCIKRSSPLHVLVLMAETCLGTLDATGEATCIL
jgi:hypothetical protein